MIEYSEIELREMISNLRLVKETSNEYELQDKSELDLTTYELLLENLFTQKINDEIEIENLIKNIKL
jgi:hypothetical protein